MKLMAILMLVCCMQISAKSNSQNITLQVRDAPLTKVFHEIKKQAGYTFIYTASLLREAKRVSLKVKNSPLEEVLAICFEEQPFSYQIINKTIVVEVKDISPVITTASSLSLSPTLSLLPPPIEIKGRVTDENGNPLAGVSVSLKGNASVGTISDENGQYRLLLDTMDSGILLFSFVGYLVEEIEINGRTAIDISMQKGTTSMEEVVVTALGISREKKALTYSVSEVSGDEFTKAPDNNLGSALSGRIAGVNASSLASGPYGSSRILIRGNGSLTGENQPLFVVNGVPINNANQGNAGTYGGIDMGDGLNSINPDDIESISVLKGGTAAALYGSRAANGVVMITTKSGRAQKGIGIDMNSTYTFERPLVYHNWQYEYGSGTRGEKPNSLNEAIANGRTSWGAKLDGSMVMQPDGQERPYVPQENNMKNFYRTGGNFINTLAINGGNQNTNFRFSISNLQDDGIVPNSSINRKSFDLSVTSNLKDKIIFQGSALYSIATTDNRTGIADFTRNPNASVGLTATNIDVRTLAPGYDENNFETPWNDYQYVTNPYFVVNKFKNQDVRRRFIGSFQVRYNITNSFYARARMGMDYFNIDRFDITPTGTLYRVKGQMTKGRSVTYENNVEGLIGFEKQLGDFSINIFAGGNQMHTVSSGVNLASGEFLVPFRYFISNGSAQTFSESYSESAINSLFGSADFSFRNYLYLTITGRNDWFSTLAKESNNLFYPSAGLSFIFSELWNNRPTWLDFGKVRASWAQVGGGAPNPYGTELTYSASSIMHLGEQVMSIIGNTIPAKLKPYTSTTTELGTNLVVLDRRLDIDLALYNRVTTDDIVSASISTASGYRDVRLNVGKMRNRGIEVLLTGRVLRPHSGTKGLQWNMTYNFAYNNNEVVKIADGLHSLVGGTPRAQNAWVYHYEGKPYGMIAGFKIERDNNGEIIYDETTGLPLQTDIVPLGKGVPPVSMGIVNDFRFNNFSLSFLLDAKFGSVLYSSTNSYATYYGLDRRTVANNVRETGVDINGVNANGDHISKNISAQNYYQGIAFQMTDEFVYKNGFVKLRQISLGYSLPQFFLNKTPFNSVNISFVARNLLLLYSQVKDVDPESSYSNNGNWYGLENQGVPPTRNMGFNLNITF